MADVAAQMRASGIRRLRVGGLEIQLDDPKPEAPAWIAPTKKAEPAPDQWAASGIRPNLNIKQWHEEHGGKRRG